MTVMYCGVYNMCRGDMCDNDSTMDGSKENGNALLRGPRVLRGELEHNSSKGCMFNPQNNRWQDKAETKLKEAMEEQNGSLKISG